MVIYLVIILVIFLGDLWIKKYIESHYGDNRIDKKCNGKILIHKYHNRGFALNIGQSRNKVVVGISLSMTLAAFLLFLLSLGTRGNRLLRTGLSLVLGGAFSNTYDRLRQKYVVDYISFGVKWKRLRKIIFNVSDFCIIIGALLSALGASQ